MSTKVIENITGTDIEIKDMGITVLAGSTYDLSAKPKTSIVNSNNLMAQIGVGNIVVQKDSTANPITYYTTTEAIRAIMDFQETMPKGTDHYKLAVHSSAKPSRSDSPHGYNTHWTGSGDDVVNHILGGGPLAQLSMVPGTATATMSFQFDPVFGKVYILHGYIGYDNAGLGDYFEVTATATASQLQTFVDLDYTLDGNKVRLAPGGPGTGTHGFAATPTLVPNLICAGWWNYSDVNGLEPSLDQSGCYDIYNIDVEVDRFMNKIPCFGDNHVTMSLEASDYSELAPGYKLVVKAYNVSNTSWTVWFFLECYRERSVNANF